MTDLRPDNIIAIDFDDDMRPFSIWTTDNGVRCDYWDVEYCRTDDRHYYHNSGSGPIYCEEYKSKHYGIEPHWNYWVKEGYPFRVHGDFLYHARWSGSFLALCKPFDAKLRQPRRLDALPPQFDSAQFVKDAFEGEVAYCPECDDWLPAERDYLCDHMTWCSRCSEYTANDRRWRLAWEYPHFEWIEHCKECGDRRDWEEDDQ